MENWMTLDQLLTEKLMECQWGVTQGADGVLMEYQQSVNHGSIEGINQYTQP